MFAHYFSDCVQEMLPFDQIRGQRTPFFNGRQANPKEQEMLSNFVDDRVFYAEWGAQIFGTGHTRCTVEFNPSTTEKSFEFEEFGRQNSPIL